MSMIKRKFYQLVLRRSSSFSLAMVVAAMFFERAYDHACEYMFEKINDGRLWMHIKHKYEETPDKVHNVTLTDVTPVKPLSNGESGVSKNLNDPKISGKRKKE